MPVPRMLDHLDGVGATVRKPCPRVPEEAAAGTAARDGHTHCGASSTTVAQGVGHRGFRPFHAPDAGRDLPGPRGLAPDGSGGPLREREPDRHATGMVVHSLHRLC